MKYYAWEAPFVYNIKKSRISEINLIRWLSIVRSVLLFLTYSAPGISLGTPNVY